MEAAVTFYLAEGGGRAEARAGLATLAGDDFRAINQQDSYPFILARCGQVAVRVGSEATVAAI
jgi:hypothetical protein